MTIYVAQIHFSDNDADDISLFLSKEKCLNFIEEERRRYQEDFDMTNFGHDTEYEWSMDNGSHFITFYYSERKVIE